MSDLSLSVDVRLCSRYAWQAFFGSNCCAPLRITELPKSISEHRKVSAWEWKHKSGRIKAKCAACHADAKQDERQMNGRFRKGSDAPSQYE